MEKTLRGAKVGKLSGALLSLYSPPTRSNHLIPPAAPMHPRGERDALIFADAGCYVVQCGCLGCDWVWHGPVPGRSSLGPAVESKAAGVEQVAVDGAWLLPALALGSI